MFFFFFFFFCFLKILKIHVCHGNGCLKEFPKNIVMFVRPIIEQTKVHFKILELLVIMFGTRHYYKAMLYECSKWHWLTHNERSSSDIVRECIFKNQNSHVTLRFRIKADLRGNKFYLSRILPCNCNAFDSSQFSGQVGILPCQCTARRMHFLGFCHEDNWVSAILRSDWDRVYK